MTPNVCSICGGSVGRHDMDVHTERLGRNEAAWDEPVGLPDEIALEGGRLVRQNATLRRTIADLRGELAVAVRDAESWKKTARHLGRLHVDPDQEGQ